MKIKGREFLQAELTGAAEPHDILSCGARMLIKAKCLSEQSRSKLRSCELYSCITTVKHANILPLSDLRDEDFDDFV